MAAHLKYPLIDGETKAQRKLRLRRNANQIWSNQNRDSINTRQDAWRKQDRIDNPEKYRDKGLVGSYGPQAPEHYRNQKVKQNGRCAVCNGLMVDGVMNEHLDHNHTTNKLRGLLCRHCNVGLHYLENLQWRQAAEQYLKDWE